MNKAKKGEESEEPSGKDPVKTSDDKTKSQGISLLEDLHTYNFLEEEMGTVTCNVSS